MKTLSAKHGKQAIRRIVFLAYIALVLGATLAPISGDTFDAVSGFDKLIHVGLFGGVSLLLWWNLAKQEVHMKNDGLAFSSLDAVFAPSGEFLALGSGRAYVVMVIDLRTGDTRHLRGHSTRPEIIAVSPSSNLVAASSTAGEVLIWNLATEETTRLAIGKTMMNIGFLEGDELLAIQVGLDTILVYDLEKGEAIYCRSSSINRTR